MPRTKKAAGTAVDKRNGAQVELSAVGGERFDPPEGLCEQALAQWDAYWADPVSQLHRSVDRGLLERWVTAADRYWRLMAEADSEPTVASRANGMVSNPLYSTAAQVENAIVRCEAQLGIGPKARAALGIAVVTERRTLADMNAKYNSGGARGDEHADEEDPRLRVVEGETS